MKSRLSSLRYMIGIAVLFLAVFSTGTPNARAANAASPNDSAISKQVHHKLVRLPWYGVFDNLEYQVNGNEVILSGELVSEHANTKSDFENAVKRIEGVTNVVNNIKVLPPASFDDQIRRAEYRAIFSKGNLGGYSAGPIPDLHIIVDGGHVTLEGAVMNQMDKTLAGIAANSVSGVFSVTNNLRFG
jgi:osmotically-inducible protein OsmY